MIHIVDLEISNIASVVNMLKKLGCPSAVTNRPEELGLAKKIILPGVGSFDHAMEGIQKFNLKEVLHQKVVQEKTPILGICLGMQLLFESSEEGAQKGLGWLAGNVARFDAKKFPPEHPRPIPHMGWSGVRVEKEGALFQREPSEAQEGWRFYFVHSYHVNCRDGGDVAATTDYGYAFPSAVERGSIYGVQFHPEKSHRFGLQLLKNFYELT